jgi:flagellar biosynthesis/type III secretory pathway M-ring protein FliF/YscJ
MINGGGYKMPTTMVTLAICGIVAVLLLTLLLMVAFAIIIWVLRSRDTGGVGPKEARTLFNELSDEEQEEVLAKMQELSRKRSQGDESEE